MDATETIDSILGGKKYAARHSKISLSSDVVKIWKMEKILDGKELKNGEIVCLTEHDLQEIEEINNGTSTTNTFE